GVLGWGVGGIEAEACMLGQPMYLPAPVVVGIRFTNALPAGSTATDLVLRLTEMLRRHGVVNKFVEFCGDGLSSLSVADRAPLPAVWESFRPVFRREEETPDERDLGRFNNEAHAPGGTGGVVAVSERTDVGVRNGSVVIAAITSCTNTSNPSVMIGAGL